MALIDESDVTTPYPSLNEAKVKYWVPIVEARALTTAPILGRSDLPDHVRVAARGILVGAVRRLAGETDDSGTKSQQTAGPFGYSETPERKSDRVLTLADRDELRQLARTLSRRRRGGTIRTPIGY